MKKIFLGLFALTLSLFMVGCANEENNGTKLSGGWELDITNTNASIPDDAQEAFNNALINYTGMSFEPVALLGKQVVAGTNYMFLCKATPVVPNAETTYKVVVVYNNLENKATISKVSDFNFTKYVNEDIMPDNSQLSGGWYTEMPEEEIDLEEKVQTAFDNATNKLVGATYKPIAVVGHQVVSGTNYAVLCYGSLATANENSGVYILTLYEDLNKTQEIVSVAYIDLSEFNK